MSMQIKKTLLLLPVAALFSLLISHNTLAFVLGGQKWATNSTTFFVNIPEGPQWSNAFEQAMAAWSNATNFTFKINRSFADPCFEDSKNGVGFKNTACGSSFGSTTLAITYSIFSDPGNRYIETDIVFNLKKSWRIFSGSQSNANDFRRVSVHELGHALGLDHENSQPSIMASFIGSIELPQQDDLNGIAALYGNTPAPPTPAPPVIPIASYNLFWRNKSTGDNLVYQLGGNIISSSSTTNSVRDTNWKIMGNDDFNGDGELDVLWRNSVTGENGLFIMNGSQVTQIPRFLTVKDQNWQMVGVGDFNNDNRADIFWRNSVTGENYTFLMNGASILSSTRVTTVADNQWKVAGVGDFNGDSREDILWRHSKTGANWIFFMNGTTISQSSPLVRVADNNWQIAGVGDFDSDGKDDLLWRNNITGVNWMFLLNGTTISTSRQVNRVADSQWKVRKVADFNNDGKADIFWRNDSTGANWMFQMNGSVITSSAQINTLSDLNWEVVP